MLCQPVVSTAEAPSALRVATADMDRQCDLLPRQGGVAGVFGRDSGRQGLIRIDTLAPETLAPLLPYIAGEPLVELNVGDALIHQGVHFPPNDAHQFREELGPGWIGLVGKTWLVPTMRYCYRTWQRNLEGPWGVLLQEGHLMRGQPAYLAQCGPRYLGSAGSSSVLPSGLCQCMM